MTMTLTTLEPESPRTDILLNDQDHWVAAGYYSDFREAVIAELDRLAGLPPDWDAQGARTIEPAVVSAARILTNRLSPNLIGPPKVVPMAKGNLQFEWHDGPRSLELEFEDANRVRYLKWHPDEGVEVEDCLNTLDVREVEDLMRWFARGVTYA